MEKKTRHRKIIPLDWVGTTPYRVRTGSEMEIVLYELAVDHCNNKKRANKP